MGTWSETGGVYTLAGSGRTAWVAPTRFPLNSAFVLEIADPTAPVRAILPASGDGRQLCLEIGVDGGNVEIRPVAWGAPGSPVTNGPDDTPPSTACSVAHGLPPMRSYQFECRLLNNVLSVRHNGTLVLSHALTPTEIDTYTPLHHFGFVADVAGARITRAEIYDLVADFDPARQVLVFVCDGNAFVSYDGVSAQQLATGFFNTAGDVDLAALGPFVYAVDGTHGVLIDLSVNPPTVEKWTDEQGLPLPGAIETTPGSGQYIEGSTRMTICRRHGSRIALAGDPRDRQNLYESAVNNGRDWDAAKIGVIGRAWATPVDLPGIVRAPIIAVIELANGQLLLGHPDSYSIMRGDPAAGLATIDAKGLTQGISGKNAVILAEKSTAVAHSPDGLLTISAGDGLPVNLSMPVLTEGIQIDAETVERYHVTVGRDRVRHNCHVFIAPRDPTDTTLTARHFCYDERFGQFKPGRGGFWPDSFDQTIGPVLAVEYQGRLLLGTRDGRWLEFDDDATGGAYLDAGIPYETKIAVNLTVKEDMQGDTVCDGVMLELARESDPARVTLYGGRTQQQAYEGADRRLLTRRSWNAFEHGYTDDRTVRAPYIVAEIEQVEPGGKILIEAMEAAVSQGLVRTPWVDAPVETKSPCPEPTTIGTPGDPGFGTGPGPGGVGGSGDVAVAVLLTRRPTRRARTLRPLRRLYPLGQPTKTHPPDVE